MSNGLLDAVTNGEGLQPHEAAKAVLTWADDLGAQRGRMVLAGSGVGHFDRKFGGSSVPPPLDGTDHHHVYEGAGMTFVLPAHDPQENQ